MRNIFNPLSHLLAFIFLTILTQIGGLVWVLSSLLALQESVGKIFIEPHLKQRLSLRNPKIRFHGCHAVRHDDHIHVEM